jgi:hypothetical protein
MTSVIDRVVRVHAEERDPSAVPGGCGGEERELAAAGSAPRRPCIENNREPVQLAQPRHERLLVSEQHPGLTMQPPERRGRTDELLPRLSSARQPRVWRLARRDAPVHQKRDRPHPCADAGQQRKRGDPSLPRRQRTTQSLRRTSPDTTTGSPASRLAIPVSRAARRSLVPSAGQRRAAIRRDARQVADRRLLVSVSGRTTSLCNAAHYRAIGARPRSKLVSDRTPKTAPPESIGANQRPTHAKLVVDGGPYEELVIPGRVWSCSSLAPVVVFVLIDRRQRRISA